MCGRFALTISARVLGEVFAAAPAPDHRPRFNICPTQSVPVVRGGGDGDRGWATCRWGLVPAWADDLKIGARLINARADTAPTKPAFRAAAKIRRCLVPSDGFYEWTAAGSDKQPYFIHRKDGAVFAFAGLWESWRGPDQAPVETFTILTTAANAAVAAVHDRMPVILPATSWDAWLAPSPLAAADWDSLCQPAPAADWELYPVGRHVNRPANDDPHCLVRVG